MDMVCVCYKCTNPNGFGKMDIVGVCYKCTNPNGFGKNGHGVRLL